LKAEWSEQQSESNVHSGRECNSNNTEWLESEERKEKGTVEARGQNSKKGGGTKRKTANVRSERFTAHAAVAAYSKGALSYREMK
jgi:hypothetical protein